MVNERNIIGRMTEKFPKIQKDMKIEDVSKFLNENILEFEMIDYLYVIDENQHLIGILSIKELFKGKEANLLVENIMEKKIITVSDNSELEQVVYIALSNGIKSVPVLNHEDQLIGIIAYNTILEIFNEEVRADIFNFGGIFHREGIDDTTINSGKWQLIRKRVTWLIVGIFGGILTASIVSIFENLLSVLLTLASFIPVLAYLSDAAGTQSETLVIRSMALNPAITFKKYIIKELIIASALAAICGIIITILTSLLWKNFLLGSIIGVSIFLSIIAAIFISTSLPFLFRIFKLDPAFASGPFATMVSDIATMVIYFGIATLFLNASGFL